MKELAIIGAGTAGTIMAHHLVRELNLDEWCIRVFDPQKTHYYQPGFLLVPFNRYRPEDIHRPTQTLFPKEVDLVQEEIASIDAERHKLECVNGRAYRFDILIMATGCDLEPDEIEGLNGEGWRRNIHDFYSMDGCVALRDALRDWREGRLVIHLAEMPIKCPVAPLEFAFLADDFFRRRGLREGVEITYVTPLSGAFTKANCSKVLGHLLDEKQIKLVPDFDIEKVDASQNVIQAYDDRQVDYDLLVSIPTNMGSKVVEHSELGDELRFIPTDPHTLRSRQFDSVFVLGDATDLPSSKAGSVAHFQAEVLTRNILNHIQGKELTAQFDGHANCFIESGNGKAFLIDFNYDFEPMEGTFPFPGVGPFSLLKESRLNHLGKLAFRWIYWNMLLKGRHLPFISNTMSFTGKKPVH